MRRWCLPLLALGALAPAARGQYAAPQSYTAPPQMYAVAPQPQPVQAAPAVLYAVMVPQQQAPTIEVRPPCLLDQYLARVGQRLAQRGESRIVLRQPPARTVMPQIMLMQAAPPQAPYYAPPPAGSPQQPYYAPAPPPYTAQAPQAQAPAAPPPRATAAAEAAPAPPETPGR